jgi:hypothetical protein
VEEASAAATSMQDEAHNLMDEVHTFKLHQTGSGSQPVLKLAHN